jgi:hypothetical protein
MKRLIVMAAMLSACTDADWANGCTSLGAQGHITCYSGGKVIYEGDSTGKIATTQNSDGWHFLDAKTQKLVRVSGDCVITN